MSILFMGLFVPRLLYLLLYIFTEWFTGVLGDWYWVLFGFLFFPCSTLWYSVVFNWYGGSWDVWHTFVFAFALVVDIASLTKASSKS